MSRSKLAKQFIVDHIHARCMDSSYSPQTNVSLYVYMHDQNVMNFRLFYIVNEDFKSFYAFYNLEDAIAYIETGRENDCVIVLNKKEMLEIDPNLEE